jgi:hypothetical protein
MPRARFTPLRVGRLDELEPAAAHHDEACRGASARALEGAGAVEGAVGTDEEGAGGRHFRAAIASHARCGMCATGVP